MYYTRVCYLYGGVAIQWDTCPYGRTAVPYSQQRHCTMAAGGGKEALEDMVLLKMSRLSAGSPYQLQFVLYFSRIPPLIRRALHKCLS
jgi:hypothetical protein